MKCPTALKILKELNLCERTCTIFNSFGNQTKKAEVRKALKELRQAINSYKIFKNALEKISKVEVNKVEDCDPYRALGICKDTALDALKAEKL